MKKEESTNPPIPVEPKDTAEQQKKPKDDHRFPRDQTHKSVSTKVVTVRKE